MSRFPRLRRRFRFPFRTSTLIERDVESELSSHLERRAEELTDQGVDSEKARREAVQHFGDLEYTKRYCDQMSKKSESRIRRRSLFDELLQDLGYGWRQLRRNPGFTTVAVLVLALGIGANAATFTLINSLLLRPIQADNPHELVALYSKHTMRPDTYRRFSYPNFEDIRELNTTFTSIMAHDLTMVGLTGGDACAPRAVASER